MIKEEKEEIASNKGTGAKENQRNEQEKRSGDKENQVSEQEKRGRDRENQVSEQEKRGRDKENQGQEQGAKHKESTVRTRQAPSPTGRVHIGSVQKFLYSYAYARANKGKYVLRIEDTDRKRFVKGAEAEIYELHDILGLKIDESPQLGGPFAPYKQSDRLDIYTTHVQKLIDEGQAYYAFETPEELAEMRKIQQQAGERPRYDGKYRDYPLEEAKKRLEAGEACVVRIKLPEREVIEFEDIIMGKIKVKTADLDDYVLLKSDGFPTYHLAVVVDDHLMEISHVFRGVEWLPTAPIHVLLYRFFGWELPQFAHIPNILDPKGGKLSKRSGSVAALDFIGKGYLPEAIINFMALLGWSPKSDQEIFSLEQFVDKFDLVGLNKSNPVYNKDKLNWFNQYYIRELSDQELFDYFQSWYQKYHPDADQKYGFDSLSDEQLKNALKLEQERIVVLEELFEKLQLFVEYPDQVDFSHKLTKKLDKQTMKSILEAYLQFIKASAGQSDWDHEVWEKGVRQIVEDLGLKAGQVFMTIRIAVTGQAVSPPLFEFAQIIGRDQELSRIEKAIVQLGE